jgi:hypothetical protein
MRLQFALVTAFLIVLAPAAQEPSLQQVLTRQGYVVDVARDEVPAPLFVRAGPGPVVSRPVAAWGLEKVCHTGWYRPAAVGAPVGLPERHELWRLAADQNKRDQPPLSPGGKTEFDPGDRPFGLWVSTEGFAGEVVYTEDALQAGIPRFPASDRHKARVFRARKASGDLPNSFLIRWEYSTNNDFQDLVTLVQNVRPSPADAPPLPASVPR